MYHPQTSGQTERLNQVLEDMLRACVLSSKGSWESWLPLAEFSYNNSYQESIKMAPFEALYGRKCRTPLNWVEPGERRYYGIDFVNDAEKKVHIIQQHMQAAQSRQKSYADKRRRPLEFKVGDYVSQGYANEESSTFPSSKQACTQICGTVPSTGKERPRGLQDSVT